MGLNKKEFKKILLERTEDDGVAFEMPVSLFDLIDAFGIEGMNELVDEFIDDGYLLMDIGYSLQGSDGENIIVRVDADASEYFKEAP
jgi:hypothetical protein